MKPRVAFIVVPLVLALGGAAAWYAWRHAHPLKPSDELLLYGNVDLRQIDLAFNNNERIAAVLALEGQHVHRGQVLARLDTSRLLPQVAQAQAQAAAQKAVVERLRNGSRPEEIAQARANVDAAKADAANARVQY